MEHQTPALESPSHDWQDFLKEAVIEEVRKLNILEPRLMAKPSSWVGSSALPRVRALQSVLACSWRLCLPRSSTNVMSLGETHDLVNQAIIDGRFEEPKTAYWTAVEEIFRIILDLTRPVDSTSYHAFSETTLQSSATTSDGGLDDLRDQQLSEHPFAWQSEKVSQCLKYVE